MENVQSIEMDQTCSSPEDMLLSNYTHTTALPELDTVTDWYNQGEALVKNENRKLNSEVSKQNRKRKNNERERERIRNMNNSFDHLLNLLLPFTATEPRVS